MSKANALLGVAALLLASQTIGCRKCDWPEPIEPPTVPAPPSLDWSHLKLEPTDVYVSLRRCGNVGRWSRFLAIGAKPLPSAFWREGGMIEVKYGDGIAVEWVMMMPNRKAIYLHDPGKGEHRLTLTLIGPDGQPLDERTVQVGPEAWKLKHRRYEG